MSFPPCHLENRGKNPKRHENYNCQCCRIFSIRFDIFWSQIGHKRRFGRKKRGCGNRNPLIYLVAGPGFEPGTFGL